MYLNVYVPQLQYAAGLVGYVQRQLGLPVASTAPLSKITDAFSKQMRRFAVDQGVPWVDFVKGQRKDDIVHERLARFEAAGHTEGVLFIGRAQEKTSLFRTEKRRNVEGRAYPWIVKTTGMVNHFYVYAVDADFGPFFLKFCSYFPYNARLCINGNEWAKRQAAKAGIGFTALDNAFASFDDPADVATVQAICASLGPDQIDALLRKWLAKVPHPYSKADRAAGYRYDISILQAEFSLTQMLDRPVSGRIFSEQVIRDNLDLGRPDQVGLVFNRRIHAGKKHQTPGRFRTRVITQGVTPSLHVDYKATTIKQYHKEGRALRTETTINNTYDFDIRKRLTNLPALCEIGFTANRRLLDVQRLSHDPARGQQVFTTLNDPVTTETGARVAGLKFADTRAMALLHALLVFRLLPDGFTNRDLRDLVGQLLGTVMSAGQMTYDLRRLRVHGLIVRRAHSNRYQVTDTGIEHALFLTRAHDRLLRTGMAQLAGPEPHPLQAASRTYQHALDQLTKESGLAA
ncbi:hypothetical protein [Nocardioides terrisoli]|uniref:hypothetical protein n=1 Tax=Nocardioides terrisoli TaxID=3388267 RepID=UPI00287B8A98|nr:hypothetical protein [Nocardioides marmorisolisilvae]